MSKAAIIIGALTLISAPANAQFYNQGNWSNGQYETDRSNDADRVLCEIERATRIIGNVASALRDRGGSYGAWGGYNCRQVSYRLEKQQWQGPDYPNTYPRYRYPQQYQQYQNGETYYQTSRPFVPIAPNGGRACIILPNRIYAC